MFLFDVLFRPAKKIKSQLSKVERIAKYRELRSVRVLRAFWDDNWRPIRRLTGTGPLRLLDVFDPGTNAKPLHTVRKTIAQALADLGNEFPDEVANYVSSDSVLLTTVMLDTQNTTLLWKLAPYLQECFFRIDSIGEDAPYWINDLLPGQSEYATTYNMLGLCRRQIEEARIHFDRVIGRPFIGDPYELLHRLVSPSDHNNPRTHNQVEVLNTETHELNYLVDTLSTMAKANLYPEGWGGMDEFRFRTEAADSLRRFLKYSESYGSIYGLDPPGAWRRKASCITPTFKEEVEKLIKLLTP